MRRQKNHASEPPPCAAGSVPSGGLESDIPLELSASLGRGGKSVVSSRARGTREGPHLLRQRARPTDGRNGARGRRPPGGAGARAAEARDGGKERTGTPRGRHEGEAGAGAPTRSR